MSATTFDCAEGRLYSPTHFAYSTIGPAGLNLSRFRGV